MALNDTFTPSGSDSNTFDDIKAFLKLMENKYNVSARISKQFKFPLQIIGMYFEPVLRSELLYVSLLENPIDIRRSRLVLYHP